MLGMAHRGRLNVLAHVLDKPHEEILAEFKDHDLRELRLDLGWRGDVKYHAGARTSSPRGQMFLTLVPNQVISKPSIRWSRACARRRNTGEPSGGAGLRFKRRVAASDPRRCRISRTGVVAETLNLSRLAGMTPAAPFTSSRTTRSDLPPRPPNPTARAMRAAWRAASDSDRARQRRRPCRMHRSCAHGLGVSCAIPARFLIDLVGYRRYGHNEGDEPAFTQPLLAKKIAEHPTVRSIWAQTQASLGQIPSERADALVKACFSRLEAAYESLKDESPETTRLPDPAPAGGRKDRHGRAARSAADSQRRAARDSAKFHVSQKLERARAKRRDVLADPRAKSVDWTTAEELAFATILADGIPIRFTGEDAERGTFSQRHAVFHDVLTGKQFVPLQELKERARHSRSTTVRCRSAPLSASSSATTHEARDLVIWERRMRRLCEWRSGHAGSVCHLRPGEMGTANIPCVSPAARIRGPGPRAFQRQARTDSAVRRGLQLATCQLHDLRASIYFGGRRCCSSQTRCRCSC